MKIVITVPDLQRCPLKQYDLYFGEVICRVFGSVCHEQCLNETRLDAVAIPDRLPQKNKSVLYPFPGAKGDEEPVKTAAAEPENQHKPQCEPAPGKQPQVQASAEEKRLCPVCGKELTGPEPCCAGCREAYRKIKRKEYHKQWYAKKRAAALGAAQPPARPAGSESGTVACGRIRDWQVSVFCRDKFWHWRADWAGGGGAQRAASKPRFCHPRGRHTRFGGLF